MTTTHVTELMILPDGMELDDVDVPFFALFVRRLGGEHGWVVYHITKDRRLSAKGRTWTDYVAKRNRRHYYFPTVEAAVEAAVEAVNDVRVNGRTFAEHPPPSVEA